MPVAYNFPNWIGPANPIQAMSAGADVGARDAALRQSAQESAGRIGLGYAQMNQEAALAQARMQMAAQQESADLAYKAAALQSQEQQNMLEMELKEKLLVDQRQRQDAQNAIENAMKAATFGLAKDKFKQEAEVASRKFAAQQRYTQLQSYYQAAGFGLEEAAARAALEAGPDLGMNLGPLASMFKTRAAVDKEDYAGVPTVMDLQNAGGTKAVYMPGGKSFQLIPPGFTPGDVQGYAVVDPVTGQPVEGMIATPGRHGMVPRNLPRETGGQALARKLGGGAPAPTLPPPSIRTPQPQQLPPSPRPTELRAARAWDTEHNAGELEILGGGGMVPMAPAAPRVSAKELRAEAIKAIEIGRDPVKVRERYKQLTGKDADF